MSKQKPIVLSADCLNGVPFKGQTMTITLRPTDTPFVWEIDPRDNLDLSTRIEGRAYIVKESSLEIK